MSERNVQDFIKELVTSHRVVLFMKGNKFFPQCGFSARAVQILSQTGVEFETFDVLSDMEVRSGIKEYAQWPTIPQLYVDGEFLGGSDIMMEMFQNGELAAELAPKP
jgi:monothiol glutaredoxin